MPPSIELEIHTDDHPFLSLLLMGVYRYSSIRAAHWQRDTCRHRGRSYSGWQVSASCGGSRHGKNHDLSGRRSAVAPTWNTSDVPLLQRSHHAEKDVTVRLLKGCMTVMGVSDCHKPTANDLAPSICSLVSWEVETVRPSASSCRAIVPLLDHLEVVRGAAAAFRTPLWKTSAFPSWRQRAHWPRTRPDDSGGLAGIFT